MAPVKTRWSWGKFFPCLVEVGVEVESGVRRIGEDVFEEGGVAVFRKCLEFLGEVAVVAICADGDAATDRGIKFAGVEFPLFQV